MLQLVTKSNCQFVGCPAYFCKPKLLGVGVGGKRKSDQKKKSYKKSMDRDWYLAFKLLLFLAVDF